MQIQLMKTDQSLPLYRHLAGRIEEMIAAGTFPPGSRLPSLRQLHRQLRISLTTVMEACRLLEDRGLIEVRPRSGFFVRPSGSVAARPAATTGSPGPVSPAGGELVLRIFHDAGDASLVPFGAAVPHPSFLPTARLNRILAREVRMKTDRTQAYDSIRGFSELRVQIARLLLTAGCTVHPEDIITTNGARHALYLSLRAVTRPGDTVILETPTYSGFLLVLESLQLTALEIATSPETGIDLEGVSRAMQQHRIAACALVPTFGNPLGHCMPAENRRKLIRLLSEARIPVIEDDVYGELSFSGQRPPALKAFDPGGNVLYCSSFSKTVAPGYRVGWVLPGRYLKEVERLKYITSVATPAPPQMALAKYLEQGGYGRQLRRLRGLYRDLQARILEAASCYFPAGTRITRPCGGHILWAELPPAIDSLLLHQRAREHGISITPGPVFSAAGGYRNFIRLNCAVPNPDIAARALQKLGDLIQEQLDR